MDSCINIAIILKVQYFYSVTNSL